MLFFRFLLKNVREQRRLTSFILINTRRAGYAGYRKAVTSGLRHGEICPEHSRGELTNADVIDRNVKRLHLIKTTASQIAEVRK
jgi:hypothetical protein